VIPVTDHVGSYRVEPDRAFADRLERELVRRLEVHRDASVGLLAAEGTVIDVPATERYVTELGLGRGKQRCRPRRSRPVMVAAAAAAVAAAVLATAVVARRDADVGRATGLVGNGLIAFVDESVENPATSDIYVVAPDGTGLRALTSTPALIEYAPAWSPDGSRLAFVRSADAEYSPSNEGSWPCRTDCQLVVVDPSTGVETFSTDIAHRGEVPYSLAWSPDGRAIVISSNFRDAWGNVGGGSWRIVDLESGSVTTFPPTYQVGWSPDSEWLALYEENEFGTSLLLVPADRIPTGGLVDVADLAGVRSLLESLESAGFDGSVWMPDGSAMLGTVGHRSIDVVTVADGERRTLIEDGFDPVVSPDGGQIAYSRGETPSGVREMWVAAADGSDRRRVTTSSTPPAWSPDGSLLLAADSQGWFTVRPDGTDRTALGIRDQTLLFPSSRTISSGIDWQPAGAHEQ
jgi:Tol biopolymer transport system component